MPPKVKITKGDIINATIDIVRKEGTQAINARTIASVLNCSTQPVFSNFATMEELRVAVVERAENLYEEYMKYEIESNKFPVYKANGMAYIRFAKEEKELFKLLYMCERSKAGMEEESGLYTEMASMVKANTGLDEWNAKLFHLEMWAFVHGIATMFATNFLDLEWDIVSKMLTDCYQGLRKQYGKE